MKRVLFIVIMLHAGCSTLPPNMPSNQPIECGQNVAPKSLEFLEQKYKCENY